MDLIKINCPQCREIMKHNTTLGINDVRPDLADRYTNIDSFICLDCQTELLIFNAQPGLGEITFGITRNLKQAIRDMEVR